MSNLQVPVGMFDGILTMLWNPVNQDLWLTDRFSTSINHPLFLTLKYGRWLGCISCRLVPYSNLSHSLFNPHLSSLVPSKIVQVELKKHCFKFKIYAKLKPWKNTCTKSRFWDVGMEFRDVGCVRIPYAINSNPFSANSDWKSIKSY